MSSLSDGIAAYKADDKQTARRLLIAAVKEEPNSERAWGWLYNVAETDKERIDCLRRMLQINPGNEKAKGLLSQLTPTPPSANPVRENQSLPATSQKQCPYCAETIQKSAIVCRFCGRDLRPGASLPIAQQPKPKKWYMHPVVKLLTFLFITPLWTLIMLEDPESSTGVKIVAGIVLAVYLLYLCPTLTSLQMY